MPEQTDLLSAGVLVGAELQKQKSHYTVLDASMVCRALNVDG